MAFIAFHEVGGAAVARRAPDVTPFSPAVAAPRHDVAPPQARLSALEWQVVALARRDTLASLRKPGRIASAMRAVFKQHNPMLADERLEALRRAAVLSWRHGYTIPSYELSAFLDAGFTVEQYETMVDSIDVARSREVGRR